MPLRVIGYDGAAYRDQITYRMDEEGKRRKVVERCPVVTLVLYFGYKKHWDKARTLYESLGESMDPDLEPYINDYKINLFEIAWLTDSQVAGFRSDFRIVADYFVQMRKKGTYQGSVSSIRHMREVLQLLSVLTDDARFLKTLEIGKEGEEPKNMSEVLDRIEQRGIEQGIEQGIERGIEQGMERGIEQGMEQGMKTINMLNARLLKDGRIKDLERSVTDSAYQERLLAELFPE